MAKNKEHGYKASSKPDTAEKRAFEKKLEPETIRPYSVRLDLTGESAYDIAERVLAEAAAIDEELSQNTTGGLETADNVRHTQKTAKQVYAYKVEWTDWPFKDCANIPGLIVPTAQDATRANIFLAMQEGFAKSVDESNMEESDIKVKYLDNRRREIPKYKENTMSWTHDGILTGMGFLKHYDVYYSRESRGRVTYTDEKKFKKKYGKKTKKEYGDLYKKLQTTGKISVIETTPEEGYEERVEFVPCENMLVHNYVKDINKAHFVGEKVDYTPQQIIDEDFDSSAIADLFSTEELGDIDKLSSSGKMLNTIHAEIITEYEEEGKKPVREKIFVVVEKNDRALLLAEKFPYHHGHSMYIPLSISPYVGEFWRHGLYQKLRSVHITHKQVVDLILNAGYITYIPSFKARKTGSFDPTIQDWYPGVVWWLQNLDDVVQWDIRPSQQNFSEWADRMQQYGFEISGVSPYNQGVPLSSGESGKKIQTLLAAGGLRMKEMIAVLNEALNELIWQMLELARQRMDEGFKIDLNGKEVDVDPEIFYKNNNKFISILDSDVADPALRLQKALKVLEIEQENPMVANSPERMRMIHKSVLRAIGGEWMDKADEILPTTEELQREQMDNVKMALAEMAQAGQLGNLMSTIMADGQADKLRGPGGGEGGKPGGAMPFAPPAQEKAA